MGETIAFGCVVAWLAMAGWSFRRLGKDTDRKATGALFLLCLVLAPFCAGVALAERKRP